MLILAAILNCICFVHQLSHLPSCFGAGVTNLNELSFEF